MRRILIIGGGYAGFYTAWKLEKKLRRGEADAWLMHRGYHVLAVPTAARSA